jgi:D-sedoheptulose 7-phosphate isomerase
VSTPLPASLGPLEQARAALDALIAEREHSTKLDAFADVLAERLRVGGGGKVMACGNGGSACDAMHFCEELTGRFRKERPALAAIACIDPGHITCTANDYGFDQIFSRWVEALGRTGDVLIVLSTSGNSPNIVNAINAAKDRGMVTAAFLGRDGGQCQSLADHEWIVPGEQSDRIQELHMLLLHVLVEAVERRLFPANYAPA